MFEKLYREETRRPSDQFRRMMEFYIENKDKMRLIEKCGEIEFRLVEGSDEFIQLEALLSQFTLAKVK